MTTEKLNTITAMTVVTDDDDDDDADDDHDVWRR